MTPDDIDLMQDTLHSVGEAGDAVVRRFYDRLFELAPETRDLFGDDLDSQRAKFLSTLTEIVAALRNLPSLAAQAGQLGAEHREHGIESRHYGLVREALIETLAAELGPSFTPQHAEAWNRGYDLIAELMQQGAAASPTPRRLADRRR